MGGSELMDEAYTSKEAALLVCEDAKEEWISYSPEKTRGEVISNNRVIAKGRVYKLSSLDTDAIYKARGLAKLTDNEIKALGLQRRM